MNLRVLTLLLSIVGLFLTACSVWIIHLFWNDPLLVQSAGVAGVNFLLGSVFWLGYTAYAMYWLVPKVDAIVDPELSEQLQLRGDFMLYRMHRLLMYGGSAACRWCNRRVHNGRSQPEFDFRRLPSNLRVPLAVHFHGMWLAALLMVSGFAAFKVAEILGLIVID